MIWQFQNVNSFEISKRSRPIPFNLSRKLLSGEYYVNRELDGIEQIVTRNGGRIIAQDPEGGVPFVKGEEGERSIAYCDGILIHSSYACGKNMGGERNGDPMFWAHVYTHQKNWRIVPVILDLEEFFNIKTIEQVNKLRDILYRH